MTDLQLVMRLVEMEIVKAEELHGPGYASLHEAYGVLMEEVEEFWEWVKMKEKQRNPFKMREELIQVAAVALRAAAQITEEESV